MKKSPLQMVKEKFESKEALVKAVEKLAAGDLWIDRVNDDKGLEHVSNRKLLHLHEVLTAVKSEFGSRDALIEKIAELDGRQKDADYRNRFGRWSTPRLWDRYRQARRQSAQA